MTIFVIFRIVQSLSLIVPNIFKFEVLVGSVLIISDSG